MIYPAPLRPGDTIGVCAPSSGVPQEKFARLERAKQNVAALGYLAEESPTLRCRAKCVSASAPTRAREFMAFYERADIALIMPPWGGEFLMDMLPLLDWERLRALPPKWVCGYSDLTTLTFPLTLVCDVATVHGSNFLNLGYAHIHESDLRAFEAMAGRQIVQESAPLCGAFTAFDDPDVPPYRLDKMNAWTPLRQQSSGAFSGRVIGGCLDTIGRLIGTAYAPVDAFLRRYAADGFVWTLESCEMASAELYRTLWQMRACGWFAGASGILIGRPTGYEDTRDFTLDDALHASFEGLSCPVLHGCDIGHMPPQMQLVNGSMAHVAYEGGRAVVRQTFV